MSEVLWPARAGDDHRDCLSSGRRRSYAMNDVHAGREKEFSLSGCVMNLWVKNSGEHDAHRHTQPDGRNPPRQQHVSPNERMPRFVSTCRALVKLTQLWRRNLFAAECI